MLVYAIGQPGAERNHVGFQSVYLVLAAGVAASFLTGDLFNLFVAFEMMLTASYVLLTLGGRRDQVRAGMTYVVISLARVGAVRHRPRPALRRDRHGEHGRPRRQGSAELPAGAAQPRSRCCCSSCSASRPALFPLFFWLPDSYPTAPSPVTAVFAGLLTKVGVYAIIRTQTLLFPDDARPATLLLVLAGPTMVVGVLGAIAQDDVKRILSFNIVSQIGYMVMGLGVLHRRRARRGVFYVVHHIVVKTTLFLTGGLIEHAGGSSRLDRLGGMVRTAPVLAVLFLVPALSLAGIPPLSGFVPKFALVDAGLAADQPAIVAREPGRQPAHPLLDDEDLGRRVLEPGRRRARAAPVPRRPAGRPAADGAADDGAGRRRPRHRRAGGPLYDLSLRAADDLLDPSAYVEAVLG